MDDNEKAIKRWDYDGRSSNTWSMVVDNVNEDGTFTGNVTFYGVNCWARNTPILNGRVESSEIKFSADLGPRCTGIPFVIRRGSARSLEGEMGQAKVWLDFEK